MFIIILMKRFASQISFVALASWSSIWKRTLLPPSTTWTERSCSERSSVAASPSPCPR